MRRNLKAFLVFSVALALASPFWVKASFYECDQFGNQIGGAVSQISDCWSVVNGTTNYCSNDSSCTNNAAACTVDTDCPNYPNQICYNASYCVQGTSGNTNTGVCSSSNCGACTAYQCGLNNSCQFNYSTGVCSSPSGTGSTGSTGGTGSAGSGGTSGGVTGGNNPFPPIFAGPPQPTNTNLPQSTQDVVNIINNALYWFSNVFWIAAAGFIFYAAYIYLTAGGDEERVKKAHKQLLWAVVAIAVGLLASGLPLLINNFLGSH